LNFLQNIFQKIGEITADINQVCKSRGICQISVMKILDREETYLWTRDVLNTFEWDVDIASVIAYLNPVLKLHRGKREQTIPSEQMFICFDRFVKHSFTTARETLAALPDEMRKEKALALLVAITGPLGFHNTEMHPSMYEILFFELDATFTPLGFVMNRDKETETKS